MTSTLELTSTPRSTRFCLATQIGWWECMVMRQLRQLQHGQLHISLPLQRREIVGTPAADGLMADLTVHDPNCFREIALGGGLGAAEAYLQGLWDTSDLVAVMRVFCRNLDRFNELDRGWARFGLLAAQAWHWLSRNTLQGSRKNIAAHYDLSNEFFQLFLDPTLMYSSGIFEQPQVSLQEASVAKLERIARKLEVRSDDHVLEIGTGWGGCAIHLARNYGCRVTTTTISQNQYTLAKQRIAEAGLSHRVDVLLTDYRQLTGQFDKLVSIEMLEAVGHEFLPTYFRTCERLLKPGGKLLVQVITMLDHRYETYRSSVDFIQKYIFPGGHLPSIGAMQSAIAQGANLHLLDAIQFPESYALTLRHWRKAFQARLDDVRRLGFDDRFIRMWNYYLCYCEAAFLERVVSVGQFVWEKGRYMSSVSTL